MITIEIAGTKFEGFESVSVSKNIETISGSFALSATSDGPISTAAFPIRAGDPCKIFIKEETIINGFVDDAEVRYDAFAHVLDITGRDRTEDVIDSTFIVQRAFNSPINLEDVIRTTLRKIDEAVGGSTVFGENGIEILNEVGTIENFSTEESVAAEIGQTLFEFFETYARKRQLLLTSNGNGDIVLTRSGPTLVSTVLQHKVGGGEANNIKSGRIKYDHKDLFHTYLMQSQSNPSAFSSIKGAIGIDQGTVADQNGQATDEKIRKSRRLVIPSKTSDNNADLQKLAEWHRDIRRARQTPYSVVVQGFHQDVEQTKVWTINQLVKVEDDGADVHATLLIKAVDYKLDLQAGSTTTIHLVPPESYALQGKIDAATAKANEQGGFLTFGG